MSPAATTLPRRQPPKTADEGIAARVISWLVFLSLGFFARLWLVGFWIFSDLLGDAFNGWVLPALGFVLVPWTTLVYAFMWTIGSNRVSGWEWIPVAIALLFDFVFWEWSRRAFR
jgi:hypothetical protein